MFFEKLTAVADPAPIPFEARRRAELKSELEIVDARLEELGREMQEFRKAHMGIDGAGRVVLLTNRADARASLDEKWRNLVKQRDAVVPRRAEVLHELATLRP
jgi:hypothetical protein